ncbi:2Fe-2S iron-sulfur cluster-binding protein [Pontimicrobium sp. IMCC45349]|uniref:2Fe-2S iron-sulfur cluster-binding protein n=1 Tax=Pontimicrobium sp. IMCC45349 TaxID=3391574 RepID=UPI0039A29569
MAQFHKLIIKEIIRETEKAISIVFNVPNELKSIFTFKAGQYITLKTKIDGNDIRRDYSLCSSPKSGILKVTVKAVEGGLFSVFANTKLTTGDTLEVAPPNGRFIFEPDTNKTRNIAAFAAGSGITPIMSIAKTVLEEEPNSKFILVYGNKTPKDTIFFNEILELHHNYLDRFELHEVFSQSEKENALFGRIEKSTVNFILKNNYKHIDIDAFYLCGPEKMINNVTDVLVENGVSKDTIHYELFTTSTATNDTPIVSNNGETQVTVLVDDEEETFTMSQKKTILEAALAEDIDAPYSCQGGICSSCIARVTEGEVTMRQNNILTDNELAEGLILTCQAQPTTPTVVVDYDDV